MQYLAQDLVLLALNPETGKFRFSPYSALRYSLMGSVLLDLVLQGKLALENDLLMGAIASTTGDEFLDRCLNEVLASSRPRTVKFWITRWSRRYANFQAVVLQNLVDLGVLKQQEQLILWLFPVQRYFLTDESIQHEIVERVCAAVLEDIGLDSRMAALISLMKASRLTDSVFRSEERSATRSRIRAIAKGELVGKAVSDRISSAQAAMMAAINASIIISASSSSSSN